MSKLKAKAAKVNPVTRNFIRKSDGIADLIQQKLKEENWSKIKLAEKLGQSPSVVTRYLTGQHNFTLATIAKLEQVLECNLITIGDQSSLDSLSESKIVEYIQQWYNNADKSHYFIITKNFVNITSENDFETIDYSYELSETLCAS